MPQGRKDLLPDEVSERVLRTPRNERVIGGPVLNRSAGVRQNLKSSRGSAPTLDLPNDIGDKAPGVYDIHAKRNGVGLKHEIQTWEDDGVWQWMCSACSDGGEGTRIEVRSAADAHRAMVNS